MTNNNNQYCIPKLPETSTISYFDVNEWDKNLTNEELKQQEHLANTYDSEYQDRVLNGPQYGPGMEKGHKDGLKLVGGVAMKTLSTVCPPAGLAVGAGVAVGGATYAICSAIDKDAEGVKDGIAVFGIGMTGAVGGAFESGSHNPSFCTLSAICPKGF